MRTLIVIIIGIAVFAAMQLAAKFLTRSPEPMHLCLFSAGLWLGFCIIDTFIGVRAGYALSTEAGIHFAVFLVPCLAGYVLMRWMH